MSSDENCAISIFEQCIARLDKDDYAFRTASHLLEFYKRSARFRTLVDGNLKLLEHKTLYRKWSKCKPSKLNEYKLTLCDNLNEFRQAAVFLSDSDFEVSFVPESGTGSPDLRVSYLPQKYDFFVELLLIRDSTQRDVDYIFDSLENSLAHSIKSIVSSWSVTLRPAIAAEGRICLASLMDHESVLLDIVQTNVKKDPREDPFFEIPVPGNPCLQLVFSHCPNKRDEGTSWECVPPVAAKSFKKHKSLYQKISGQKLEQIKLGPTVILAATESAGFDSSYYDWTFAENCEEIGERNSSLIGVGFISIWSPTSSKDRNFFWENPSNQGNVPLAIIEFMKRMPLWARNAI